MATIIASASRWAKAVASVGTRPNAPPRLRIAIGCRDRGGVQPATAAITASSSVGTRRVAGDQPEARRVPGVLKDLGVPALGDARLGHRAQPEQRLDRGVGLGHRMPGSPA